MGKEIITYALYSNKDQDELYELADSKVKLKEISLEYTSGVWFEYDTLIREGHADQLKNERPYKGKVKFGDKVKETIIEDEKDTLSLTSRLGDLRS